MNERLLWKSASVLGFFLPKYAKEFPSHLQKLVNLKDSGKLQVSHTQVFIVKFDKYDSLF